MKTNAINHSATRTVAAPVCRTMTCKMVDELCRAGRLKDDCFKLQDLFQFPICRSTNYEYAEDSSLQDKCICSLIDIRARALGEDDDDAK